MVEIPLPHVFELIKQPRNQEILGLKSLAVKNSSLELSHFLVGKQEILSYGRLQKANLERILG